MNQTTRKFLALLGAEACGKVCERLAQGPATKGALSAGLELTSRDLASTLEGLALVGLVSCSKRRDGKKRGRPEEVWRLVALDELEGLERYVNEMRHRLIDRE